MRTAPSSNYDHSYTSLGQLQNTPIAVGHWSTTSGTSMNGKKVEALQDGIWNTLSDFPFVQESIDSYSMVNFNGALYLFGKYQ